jgi:ABC-2 type transport system permease protein
MRRIRYIAVREFLATVATRGFLIGLLIVPAMIALGLAFGSRLVRPSAARIDALIAVVDPTGLVAPELQATIEPAHIRQRRTEIAQRALNGAPDEVRAFADGTGQASTSERTIEMALGRVPDLHLVVRPPGDDLERQKEWLTAPLNGTRRVALIVVHPTAVISDEHRQYGSYDLFVAPNLENRLENQIQQSLGEAIVNARLRAQHLDPVAVDQMVRVARVRSVTVTKNGERPPAGIFNRVVPFAFVGLLFFGVMMGGQSLLTSTIEEKSSRVVEVLLSAVSPMELMAGKILGQMGVSLVALGLYVIVGLLVLVSFAVLGLLDPWVLLYFLIFFLIAYLVVGSLMAAVGAAVSDMREAQSLMMPIMVILITPWILAAPITANPNSAFSTLISFIPPVNSFAMMLRITSIAPPPPWQIGLSIGIGAASVVGAVWFAAKVFRIGLLLHGKPPNVATLIRWVRAA